MKKILFIVPTFGIGGGTNTSLYNYLELLKLKNNVNCELYVFSLTHYGCLAKNFDNITLISTSVLLETWLSTFSSFTFKQKIIYSPLKIIKRLLSIFNIDSLDLIYRLLAKSNKFKGFDKVIAYQEGYVTEFASYIDTPERVAWVHCNLKFTNINPQRELKYYLKYDKIIAVSKYTMNVCKEVFPSISNKIGYIYNIIDQNSLIEKASFHDKDLDKLSKDDILIISVGRLDPIKQFSLIPMIASKLSNSKQKVYWYIIGSGTSEEENRIYKEILRFNVENIVRCVGFKSNPYPLFKRANLYVCLSKSEACPMVFLESNILNTYVISNDFPSANELLKEGVGEVSILDSIPARINYYINNGFPHVIKNDSFNRESIDKFLNIMN